MAVTKIHPIKSTLKKALDYIENPAKTDEKMLVSSFACSYETADIEFELLLSQAMQKGNNLAHHLIQSFAPGETTPEQAHEIGRQLADEVLQGKYPYVLTTHIDKGHIHNHVICCAVDMVNQRKYVSNRQSYAYIRRTSDRLCKEHGLSVVMPGQDRGKSYAEWDAHRKGTSWKAKLKTAIDAAIPHAKDFDDFLRLLQEQGYEIDLVDIRRDGTIDLEHLKELLRPDTIAVAVTLVDSELGGVQPVKEISEILQAWPNCHLHVDATQAVGKLPVSFEGVGTMRLTAHKFYGLNGIGLLLKRRRLALEPLIHGGESTTIYRSGTPTVALAASLETALNSAVNELPKRSARVKEANLYLRTALSKYPKVRINSPESAIPHILNLSVENVKGTVFQRELDAEGVCVSVKSACSSDGLPSRAVFAVSRDRKNALSSWRVSLRHLTTQEELDGFLRAFDACYTRLTQL